MIDAPLPDADARWQQWKERGQARDRATATHMRRVLVGVTLALIVWAVTRLT